MRQQKKGKILLGLKLLNELKILHARKLLALKKERNKPIYWVNPFLIKRSEHDLEIHLLNDLKWGSGDSFTNFTRINVHQFEDVLTMVSYYLFCI